MALAHPSDGDLRFRYLDWCSARVAERFQELSLDEIWERAQLAERSLQRQSLPPASLPSPSAPPENPGYLDLVRLLSVQLADELGLPSFEEWSEEYQRDPHAFHGEMIGFGAHRAAEEPSR